MTEDKQNGNGRAGGVFIALGLLFGAVIGVVVRQPSIGMVAGLGVGVAIALVLWLRDKRK